MVVQKVSTLDFFNSENASNAYSVIGIFKIIRSDSFVNFSPTSKSSLVECPSISIATFLSVISRYLLVRSIIEPYLSVISFRTTVFVTIPFTPLSIQSFRSSGSPASQISGPIPFFLLSSALGIVIITPILFLIFLLFLFCLNQFPFLIHLIQLLKKLLF